MEKVGNFICSKKTKCNYTLFIYIASAEKVMRLAVVGIKATTQVALMSYE
ncbi:MAG: hypothetical protein ACI4BC_09125 [Muribaculaceae bacterium]